MDTRAATLPILPAAVAPLADAVATLPTAPNAAAPPVAILAAIDPTCKRSSSTASPLIMSTVPVTVPATVPHAISATRAAGARTLHFSTLSFHVFTNVVCIGSAPHLFPRSLVISSDIPFHWLSQPVFNDVGTVCPAAIFSIAFIFLSGE